MGKQGKVLIVDDTATTIAILSACLEDNYELITTRDGEQCLHMAKQFPQPDLILLDIEMPGMNGYQVCRKLSADPATSQIPIIFVTARLDIKDEEKGFSLGAVDYIVKPIRPAIVAARVKTHITLKKQKNKLERMALYDQLTDLYNRHFLLNAAKQKISSALRHKFSVCVLMIDMDNFKLINDGYGHTTGDAVLKAVAQILKNEYRDDDIAARFGGEEFLILLGHCDLTNAKIKAENLRAKIEALNPLGIAVTVSIGLSLLINEEDSFPDLLDRADKALYQAKQNGRNQVAIL
jgi:diguanylate cyclase (GGDEF)-like protein